MDGRPKAERRKEFGVLLMPAYGAMSAIFMGLQQIVILAQVETFDPADKIANVAAASPQAELHPFPGMGHVIAQPPWDAFADIITRTAGRAQ